MDTADLQFLKIIDKNETEASFNRKVLEKVKALVKRNLRNTALYCLEVNKNNQTLTLLDETWIEAFKIIQFVSFRGQRRFLEENDLKPAILNHFQYFLNKPKIIPETYTNIDQAMNHYLSNEVDIPMFESNNIIIEPLNSDPLPFYSIIDHENIPFRLPAYKVLVKFQFNGNRNFFFKKPTLHERKDKNLFFNMPLIYDIETDYLSLLYYSFDNKKPDVEKFVNNDLNLIKKMLKLSENDVQQALYDKRTVLSKVVQEKTDEFEMTKYFESIKKQSINKQEKLRQKYLEKKKQDDIDKLNKPKLPSNTVFVVYGRNEKSVDKLFDFLRAIKLHPLIWDDVLKTAPNPEIFGAINESLTEAIGVIVLLTDDEDSCLREELRIKPEDSIRGYLPRPNVILEYGIAYGLKPSKTIAFKVENLRNISDLLGKYILPIDNSEYSKKLVVKELKRIGLPVDDSRKEWLKLDLV